jgi:hypothetical protein
MHYKGQMTKQKFQNRKASQWLAKCKCRTTALAVETRRGTEYVKNDE